LQKGDNKKPLKFHEYSSGKQRPGSTGTKAPVRLKSTKKGGEKVVL
jgi:hypothetical protein